MAQRTGGTPQQFGTPDKGCKGTPQQFSPKHEPTKSQEAKDLREQYTPRNAFEGEEGGSLDSWHSRHTG